MCTVCALLLLPLLLIPSFSWAHEVRPGYLNIIEQEPGTNQMLWKTPSRIGLIQKIDPILPGRCQDKTAVSRQRLPGAYMERRLVTCEGGLAGETIRIDGLTGTFTDVLARIHHADGRSHTVQLRAQRPSFKLPLPQEDQSSREQTGTAASYIHMGINHILLGIDHLLFVFGLLLLSRGWGLLVKTIVAFTVGHGISLALATLGVVNVPSKPLNAVIALSIVFLASGELTRADCGKMSLTIRNPWLVSFGFGLLYGLGFADALVALGLLPRADIPFALLSFNIGVEVGQIFLSPSYCWLCIRCVKWRSRSRLREG